MTLDHLRGIALDRHALDHIRIKRALCEKSVATMFARAISSIFLEQLLGRMLKHFDEFIPDELSLGFRIGHSF